MFLREFIYFEKNHEKPVDDSRYISGDDKVGVLSNTDTRKTRLTLKDINKIRKAAESHDKEKREEQQLVRKMYKIPEQPAPGI